jgi:hypothetical protein
MTGEPSFDQIVPLIDSFVKQIHLELHERWKAWAINLSENEIHEVVGALIARQVTLTTQMAESPSIWNGHVAPIILRTMADTYISLAWILKNPIERSQKYILHGLGQAKLQLEHNKAEIGEREPTPQEKALIDTSEEWINSQRFTFLTEVNFGSWSGITTRQMAEEADCLDFYNYVYTPFSACTHSMWHHIARYNLRLCENPLHQYHHVPDDPETFIDLHYFCLAAKYLHKTFSVFDIKFNIKVNMPSAYYQLCDGLNKLSKINADAND